MARHTYRISLERVSDNRGNRVEGEKMEFLAESHDDILALARRIGKTEDRDLAFLVGLKLFGEILLSDRDNPRYKDFLPHFGAFMKAIKESRQGHGG